MADRSPLPPESPEECETDTETAKSATCSSKSTDGDRQSIFLPPTRHSPEDGMIPGVEEYARGMQTAATDQLPGFSKPRQPKRQSKPIIPMEGKALEIAGRLKEMFHAYTNRQTEDNRSAQSTMGPSEIGTPCDRRIAMSLLRLPPVNSGGDGWAAFVGTCTHVGLAEMFMWANAGSGRYHPEVPLTFPSEHVPKGTTDLIDTALLMVDDHKLMGGWSLAKLMTEGPSPTYRVQAHTYGFGAKLKGFDIKDVAIVAWPREEGTLDKLYVWTEPYDPSVARNALERVDRIGESVKAQMATLYGEAETSELEAQSITAASFPINNSDCRYCPYYLKGAAKSEGGVCNGRS